jgi:hypothetical protein
MVMVVPIPATVTDMVVVHGMRYADTDVCAERADMGAYTHAARTDARARADRTYIGAGADLRHGCTGKEQRACEY